MTSRATLSHSDATPQWASMQRHQIVGVLVTFGALATWLLIFPHATLLIGIGVGAGLVAVPIGMGETVGTMALTTLRFVIRPKWNVVKETTGPAWSAQLDHTGRLDLSGKDAVVVSQIEDLCTRLATLPTGGEVMVRVDMRSEVAHTMLSASGGGPPVGWHEVDTSSAVPQRGTVTRERWSVLHDAGEVTTILRVHLFSGSSQRGLLEALQRTPVPMEMGLRFDVLPAARAVRLTGRAVHRGGIDGAAATTLGFRRSARSDHDFERVRRREQLVAEGRPLMRLGVYLTVHAATTAQLRERVLVLQRSARDAGIGLHRGRGRQRHFAAWSREEGRG